MFSFKKRYYFIIESIKDINLRNIKKRNKFTIVYRNKNNKEDITKLIKFRNKCRLKSIQFYVANSAEIAISLKADGIYLSSHNKSFRPLSLKKSNFHIIGSAHSKKEISIKIKQGCNIVFLSKLFRVSYSKNAPYLGVIKFNNFLKFNANLIPLGGINHDNLNSLKMIKCEGIVIMSAIKKKPTNIISRLF